jgi:hypothetical protein
MGDSFIFQFIKKWRQVGAIMPSSIFLVEDMLEEVDWNSVRLVVELGARMTAKIRIVGGTSPGEKAVYIDGQKLTCVSAVEFRMTACDTEVVLRVVGGLTSFIRESCSLSV